MSAGCTWVLWIWDLELLGLILFLRHLTKQVERWGLQQIDGEPHG